MKELEAAKVKVEKSRPTPPRLLAKTRRTPGGMKSADKTEAGNAKVSAKRPCLYAVISMDTICT